MKDLKMQFSWMFGAAVVAAVVLTTTAPGRADIVTDGMVLWLDASDSSTLFQDSLLTIPAVDGDPIGGWRDKSGNDFHATQLDTDFLPARNDTAMNGFPSVRFTGAEADGLVIDDGLSLARPYTVFIVNQYYGSVKGRTLRGQTENWLHGMWGGKIASYATGFVGSNPSALDNYGYVADTTGTPDAGTSSLFVNGVDLTTNPAPTGAPGNLGLGGGGPFGESSDADISEVVIYDRVLDASELTQVRDFLHSKYGIAPEGPSNNVLSGNLGTFSGGDPGEGLDLSGAFAYAVNVGGPGGMTVGDATFTDGSEEGMGGGSSPGVSITDGNEAGAWYAPEYGDSPNDDALETVMQSIRWNTPPGLDIDLEVTPGQEYKLQLLFAESCCDRGFDIAIEGEKAVDNFNVQLLQGGINITDESVVFTKRLIAQDGVLNISLGGQNLRAADNNALLMGVTLESVPEPGSVVMLLNGLAGIGLLALRRRRRA